MKRVDSEVISPVGHARQAKGELSQALKARHNKAQGAGRNPAEAQGWDKEKISQ
jgi:hypothetical protein